MPGDKYVRKSDPTQPEYSVYILFPDGTYECLDTFVTAEEALKTAHRNVHKPAALIGIISRVIITDGGDHIVFEWKFKEGITWPQTEATKRWSDAYKRSLRTR
jgi:hypothetical protein